MSFSFLEIVQHGGAQFVRVDTVAADAIAKGKVRRKGDARLLMYTRAPATSLPLQLYSLFRSMLPLVTAPQSFVRAHLNDYTESQRHVFSAPMTDAAHVANFTVEKAKGRAWVPAESKVVVETDGSYEDVLTLLDAIYKEEESRAATAPGATATVQENAPPARARRERRDGRIPRSLANQSDAEKAAVAYREEFLKYGWRDAKGVAELLGMNIDAANPNQYAYKLRKNGELLGVWNARDRSYLYPDFQFEMGTVRPRVGELLEALPFEDDDRLGWRRAFWLYSPHALLEGQKPADVFATDPQRVIDVATEEFKGNEDGGW
ncbi:hypothetical protein [Paraburkholderia sp. SIMBA_054]|uniref:hypothetical protein n=1 Tax=Paraburkholderia sp. SIMBA_054 TaxID=3085795 RepID=UPI00397DC172